MKNTVILSVLSTLIVSSAAFADPVQLLLKLKERVSMTELARSVQDPSSPRFHKFYTPAEIRALSAPSDLDYANLLQTLKNRGFTIVKESPSHLVVTVVSEQATVENTIGTRLKRAPLGLTGTVGAVNVPSDLTLVDSVVGLDQTKRMHPHYRLSDLQPVSVAATFDANEAHKKPTPTPTPAQAGPVAQADIKTKYGFDPIYAAGVNGGGQHIAIATYDGFHIEDVNAFYVQSNISPAPAVDQVTFNGTPAVNEDSAVETELDSEFSGMIAPGAQIHVFASADNSDAGELAMFTAILDDGRAKVVNYSWGACEKSVTAAHRSDMDSVYARALAQGVNIMIATGDSGADGCGDGSVSAGWPATEPNAVAVGGTTYGLDSSGNLSETAWSGTGQDGGSGGGVSTFYDLPAYQSNFQSPYTKRSIPDVSFNANNAPGQQLWTSCSPNKQTGACAHGKGGWMTIGGTSMAAPQWSGFMALVGQSRANANKSTLGFLNPIIYAQSASDYAANFHDVTSGNNGAYKAGPGWDAVTGLGSMNASALLNYLTNQ